MIYISIFVVVFVFIYAISGPKDPPVRPGDKPPPFIRPFP